MTAGLPAGSHRHTPPSRPLLRSWGARETAELLGQPPPPARLKWHVRSQPLHPDSSALGQQGTPARCSVCRWPSKGQTDIHVWPALPRTWGAFPDGHQMAGPGPADTQSRESVPSRAVSMQTKGLSRQLGITSCGLRRAGALPTVHASLCQPPKQDPSSAHRPGRSLDGRGSGIAPTPEGATQPWTHTTLLMDSTSLGRPSPLDPGHPKKQLPQRSGQGQSPTTQDSTQQPLPCLAAGSSWAPPSGPASPWAEGEP